MKLKLNNTVSIDLPKLIESRLLVQANSGGGKSWAIRRIIEQAFGHVQIIVLDPEGEFGNLRQQFDFAYAGKGGDTAVDPRSAALLATRLLELKASTIVDLYELPPQDRKRFVRLFCESMVNAPKELWHDTLIIIDEAHVFAPEKGESEAMGSVIDLATRGRKRGYCVVLATQRLPKLNKDAAAECNNKLIGRASQDIDRKRAAEELGFTTREQILSLRDLNPGEFYIFGPATGTREVVKTTIGDVQVKPPKRGVSRGRIPAPSVTVKKILAKLKDLPQEALEEARTLQSMQTELRAAKSEIRLLEMLQKRQEQEPVGTPAAIKKAINEEVALAEARKDRALKDFKDKIKAMLLRTHGDTGKILALLDIEVPVISFKAKPTKDGKPLFSGEHPPEMKKMLLSNKRFATPSSNVEVVGENTLTKGARQVLTYLRDVYPNGKTKTQLSVAAGYAPGGGFNNMLYELTGAELIHRNEHGRFAATLGEHTGFDTSLSKWDSKLTAGARKIFHLLLKSPDEQFNKEYIAQETGYSLGGGFNNMIYELTGKELVIKIGAEYKINPEILDL